MIIVHHLMKMEVGYLCSIANMKMKWNAQDKDIFVGHFISHFTGLRLSREELDWVYDRWLSYQEGFSCELINCLVPLGEI